MATETELRSASYTRPDPAPMPEVRGHNDLIRLIRQRGALQMANYLRNPGSAVIAGWPILWAVNGVGGALLFFQVDLHGETTQAPRILVVNAPEAERPRWQAIVDAHEDRDLIHLLMLPVSAPAPTIGGMEAGDLPFEP